MNNSPRCKLSLECQLEVAVPSRLCKLRGMTKQEPQLTGIPGRAWNQTVSFV